ncbi:hypothetical protein NBRC116493_24170 [Aurantivibrio infirmus]
MPNLQFFLEPPGPKANADRPPPLVIQADSLSLDVIKAIPLFLIENVDAVHNIEGLDTHLEARPIQIEISGETRISEKVIWSIVIQNLPDAAELIVRYVNAHLDRIPDNGELGWCSFLDIVGQEALYAFLDLDLSEIDDKGSVLKIIDCFILFIKRCDLDHYYLPESYIENILNYRIDEDQYIDLLTYRLFNGQEVLDGNYEWANRYLSKNGVLKLVVDKAIESDKYGSLDTLDILKYCAPVYGNKHELTNDVLNYCCKLVPNFNRTKTLKNFQPSLMCQRSKCDADWERRNVGSKYASMNTGFHYYDGEKNTWEILIPE